MSEKSLIRRRRPDRGGGTPAVCLAAVWLAACLAAGAAGADMAKSMVESGNRLYAEGSYVEAVGEYDRAITAAPEAAEPKFNKANAYYRLDDYAGAADLFRQAAAETKDMDLVARAKYNLGNCHFQTGSRQRDSDLEKALKQFESAIASWRQVLEIEPENEKAARNIEVARLTIKDIIDQLKKQQQEQQQQGDQQDQKQQGDQKDQQQGQQDQKQQGDQQGQQDQKQQGDQQDQQDQKQQGEQQQAGDQKRQEKKAAPAATADEILDKEKQRRRQKAQLRPGGYQKVDRDW